MTGILVSLDRRGLSSSLLEPHFLLGLPVEFSRPSLHTLLVYLRSLPAAFPESSPQWWWHSSSFVMGRQPNPTPHADGRRERRTLHRSVGARRWT